MLLMIFGALSLVWLAVVVVALALCVNAARADRDDAVAERTAPGYPDLRLIA